VPNRTEVQVYEAGVLIFGGVVTEVSRESTGGNQGTGSAILSRVKCSDYTALLDEVVINQYKAPYDTLDYQLICGGYATDKDKNGLKITKISNGDNGSGKRRITVSLNDSHDLLVGQQVIIDQTTNYNSTWTVYSIDSVVSYTADNTALTYSSGVADETSGRSTPYTASIFSDVRTSDPYSGATYNLGIDYTTYVEQNTNDKKFSPISYLPDGKFPSQLGAKVWIPLSSPKSETGRTTFDPRAMDARKDLRLARIDSDIVERYAVRAISSYDSTSDFFDVTTIGTHALSNGQTVALGNINYNNTGTYSSGFRVTTAGPSTVRVYSPVDPGIQLKYSDTISGVFTDGAYATYTATNTFSAGDPVGIYGITESGSSGTLNVQYSIIEEATPTGFKIKNSSSNTWVSGGVAYTSYIEVVSTPSVQADAQRFGIVAAKRENGVTTIWHNGPASWFDTNDVVYISGSAAYDGKFIITDKGNGAASSSAPFHVSGGYRQANNCEIIVANQSTPWAPALTSTNKASHPFKVGDSITLSVDASAARLDGLNGSGITITQVNGANISFTKSGGNLAFESLSKTQRGTSTVYLSTAGYSYIKFADGRPDDGHGAQNIGQSATVTTYNYSWTASPGAGRSAATPGTSFTTMPNDSLSYIGGRQAVSFTSSLYQGLSTKKVADVAKVAVVSNVGTITTKHAHGIQAGEGITVSLVTNTSLNGGYNVTATTATTLTFNITASDMSSVDTGTVKSDGIGFASFGSNMSSIFLIRPSSLPSAGNFATIWHGGSKLATHRREIRLSSTGEIHFRVLASTSYASGIFVAAGETAIIYVSYNRSTGALVIQKNDTTPYSTTATTTDTRANPNFTIGYGYSSSGAAESFYNGLIGDIINFDRVLTASEQSQIIAWFAHWYTRADLLDKDNTYRSLSNLPGKSSASKLKEPFNGMTLRQAMDYLSKKTNTQYWVDANKRLHYKLREIKNFVSNSVFEDAFGNAGTTGWATSGFTLTDRTGGPYGYGYALTATSSTLQQATSKKFDVSTGDVLWASAMIKTGNASTAKLNIRLYKNDNTYSDHFMGGAVSTVNQWQYMWGVVKVPGEGFVSAAIMFEHGAATSYTSYWANPLIAKITGEFGFADYGIAPSSTVEYMYDSSLNAIIPLKPFESPNNISQSGSVTNRVHVYAKAILQDSSGDVSQSNTITGQVVRYTFDYVQGVWQTHGKVIESSTVNNTVETQEDAAFVAAAQFSQSGKNLQSFQFSHPTHASDGRLTVGSIVPFLWSQVGIAEPMVVKSQSTEVLGGEIYYSVTLGSEPAFTTDAVILVQRNEITQSLGPGQLQFSKPSQILNLTANTIDLDGKPTTADLNIALRWFFDRNDPRNKLFTNFEVQRRREELQQTVVKTAGLAKSGTVISRTAAAPGAVSTVTVTFAGAPAIRNDIFITIKGWSIKGEKAGSLNGTWEIQSVATNGSNNTEVTFQIYAGTKAITAISKTKATAIKTVPNIQFSWYETVKTVNTGWGDLLTSNNQAVVNNNYTDSDTSPRYHYQYRVRAITKDSDGGIRRGDWTYLPGNYVNTTDKSAWLYVTRDLAVANSPAVSSEDSP
jgi:hypothetical protein